MELRLARHQDARDGAVGVLDHRHPVRLHVCANGHRLLEGLSVTLTGHLLLLGSPNDASASMPGGPVGLLLLALAPSQEQHLSCVPVWTESRRGWGGGAGGRVVCVGTELMACVKENLSSTLKTSKASAGLSCCHCCGLHPARCPALLSMARNLLLAHQSAALMRHDWLHRKNNCQN
jgi:hypothetical protein